jgi:N-methylhydantoinase B/oxoprolinase/acetone carboxylase alpha subunit
VSIDPVSLEVVRHRLERIAEEMDLVLLKSAYSPIVKEALDAAAAIYDPAGRIVAQSLGIPGHLGMMVSAVRNILTAHPPETMHKGDIFIMNDPYEGASHLPDLTMLMPVFSGGRVAALTASMVHHQDMGGATPGSTPANATEIFAEGLRLPILKLHQRGIPNQTLLEIIRRNVRVPDIVMGDIHAQIGGCRLGRTRILELFRRYGRERVAAYVEELMDRSERLTRRCIERIPDGRYTFFDYVDDDGIVPHAPVKVQVTVEVSGSDLHVDFTGSSPQVSGPINCPTSFGRAAVYYVVRAITDPSIPDNEGCYRPVHITFPPGTVVNPLPPAAVSVRIVTAKRMADVLMGAFAQAVPDRVHACSNGQLSVIYVGGTDAETQRAFVGFIGVPWAGGMGARRHKDGIDVVATDVENTMNFPVEACEMEFPLRIHEVQLWRDSGGAGRQRGGLGYRAVVEWLRGAATMSHRRDRHDFAPWGLFGGMAAPTCKTIFRGRDGTERVLPSKAILQFAAGDRLEIYTTGGGGYGDPLERFPQAVLEDVLDGRISRQAAEDVYGVVVDLEAESVDLDATAARRALLAGERRRDMMFDRGPEVTARCAALDGPPAP